MVCCLSVAFLGARLEDLWLQVVAAPLVISINGADAISDETHRV